ncbi:MAG: DUF4178 domain-containing protein [Sporocytophaga sp.]|nr:DUF4178 domain-containing protein [Sporocytophaga sp.]
MDGSEINSVNNLPSAEILECPKCGSDLRLTGFLLTKNIACGKCHSLFAYANGNLKVIKIFKKEKKKHNHIPIGTKGTIDGRKFEVVGFANYREANTPYAWDEYTLFNPIHGFTFLSVYEGHWNYFEQTILRPRPQGGDVNLNGDSYRIFNRYKQKTDYALGEFPWDISENPSTITEYINPPHILAHDKDTNEETWFLGRYITPKEIKEAFNLQSHFPEQTGIGSTQLHSSAASLSKVKQITLYVVLSMLVLQIILSISARDKIVFKDQFNIPGNQAGGIVSPPFELENTLFGKSNLQVELIAPVHNSWMEADITLINDKTGEEFHFEQGVEYYSGYEGGEAWSEGQNYTDNTLSSIPAGKYHLNIFPATPPDGGPGYFQLKLTQDVSMLSNFFITLLIALIFPIALWISISSFEAQRWMNSDFSPYSYE